jgi:Lon protease-like protein
MACSDEDPLMPYPGVVPLFPLPDHIFLPDLPTPYYVIEEPERQMIEDLLTLPEELRWLSIPRLSSRARDGMCSNPPIEPVATVGQLLHAVELPDGHYHIVVRGVFRARLVEVPCDKPYRMAFIEPLRDVDGVHGDRLILRDTSVPHLLASLAHQLGDAFNGISDAVHSSPDLSTAIYRLGAIFVMDLGWRQRLLEAQCVVERLAIVEDALAATLALGFGSTEVCDA